jgi:hypothetical protein
LLPAASSTPPPPPLSPPPPPPPFSSSSFLKEGVAGSERRKEDLSTAKAATRPSSSVRTQVVVASSPSSLSWAVFFFSAWPVTSVLHESDGRRRWSNVVEESTTASRGALPRRCWIGDERKAIPNKLGTEFNASLPAVASAAMNSPPPGDDT